MVDANAPAEAALEPEALDLGAVDDIVAAHGTEKGAAIPILQDIQKHFRYLPEAALRRVCAVTDITPAQIQGIATFYTQFRHMPVGRHMISVCHGTACHVAGAQTITEGVRTYLDIPDERDTDSDRLFTVQKVACLGCCSLAPVMSVDGEIYGHLTRDNVGGALGKFLRDWASGRRGEGLSRAAAAQQGPPAATPEFRVSLLSCCVANGTMRVKHALERELRRLGHEPRVKSTGCVGLCDIVPFVDCVGPDGAFIRYSNVTPEAVPNIVRTHVRPAGIIGTVQDLHHRTVNLLLRDSAWVPAEHYDVARQHEAVCGFMDKQRLIVMAGSERMDPLDLGEYLERDGYRALEKCLTELTPEQIISTVEQSGLRGRGGGGYPTATKWRTVRAQPAGKKYMVLNGDEGDPGAFMDRVLLEACPHRVLEGMAIAACAVGADEGYLYIRNEYPFATERVREAIRQAEQAGYLGEGILGTEFKLRLHVRGGAGAFVCGEETGLIASIEGRRGTPHYRPPYPSQHGLWGCPTSINNVETYATIPWILLNGAEAFASTGTGGSKGTKIFALAGAVNRGGLVEVPMGTTITEIVEEIGGGVRGDHSFKAVQIGGPSGGCIPASLGDVRVDYQELTRYGAMMGSGGLVVMDDTACMVDVARYFMQFAQNESCGQCTFCRVGTRRMLDILERLCNGEGERGDIEKLEELAERVRHTSLCGLGKTAPNPVITTLRYFRDEYEAHIEGRCPAHRCRALIRYSITDRCIGCTLCAQHCPSDAIEIRPYEQHEIDQEKCVRCGTCYNTCPADAIEVE